MEPVEPVHIALQHHAGDERDEEHEGRHLGQSPEAVFPRVLSEFTGEPRDRVGVPLLESLQFVNPGAMIVEECREIGKTFRDFDLQL